MEKWRILRGIKLRVPHNAQGTFDEDWESAHFWDMCSHNPECKSDPSDPKFQSFKCFKAPGHPENTRKRKPREKDGRKKVLFFTLKFRNSTERGEKFPDMHWTSKTVSGICEALTEIQGFIHVSSPPTTLKVYKCVCLYSEPTRPIPPSHQEAMWNPFPGQRETRSES